MALLNIGDALGEATDAASLELDTGLSGSKIPDAPPVQRIEYIAPNEEEITTFASIVCSRIAARRGKEFERDEVISGLTEVLEAIVACKIDVLNRRQSDSGESSSA